MIMGVDDEMKKLFSTFTTIQAVLEDAEQKQLQSKQIRNWLSKLTDLVYEIDDILDECVTYISKQKFRGGKLTCYSLKKIQFRHNIGRKMKEVRKKLGAVAAERLDFHLREMDVDKPREVAAARETGSILNESHQVFGRDEDKEKIVDILLNHVKENQGMSVLPIIGVGGLGKTTLAQLIFNDNRVSEHFERKLWICVSDNFDLKTLVRAMIESATESGSASDLMQLDTLQRRLWDLLNGKRYLLVLDDVWNTDQNKWFGLKNILACGSNGTSIIVSTRLEMVADIMGTFPPHRLKELSEEHCWLLLRERAFREEAEEYPNLEVIGKQIVKKCGGVPMAAKALGGLLRFKRTEKEWNYVKESELWNLAPEETLILPALRLSYHHLPLALRQCFAYFAVFPKDFSIRKEELISLWVAHGYISTRETLEVEDVGNEICNELVLRSLFQYCPFVTPPHIMMHNLVHDLAQSIMESKVPGVQVERQVTIASTSNIRQVNLRAKSVAFPTSVQHDMDISSILMKFSRLRVLDASRTTIQDLPSTVGNLKHMRLLNLSGCEIHTLPNSLCSLWNLQTLNLNGCWRLVALPKNMRCLNNLRHLFLASCSSLSGMPSKIGELTRLRTLTLFIVGHNRGNQLEELQSLNLGDLLEIRHLERVETYMDAKKANLVQKTDLRHLRLEWESQISASKSREDRDERVLEALVPHPNLESLHIRGFGGRSCPVWVADSAFTKMVGLVIVDCQYCLHLPQLGRLPHLKFLKLENLGVEYITEGGSIVQFPSLSKLELMSLPNLKGVFKEEQPNTQEVVFPKLVNLKIDSCSSSFIFRKLTNLKSLTIYKPEETSLPEEGLRALKSLSHLWIEGSETMTCLPPQGWLPHLSALTVMTIKDCSEFVELPEEIIELHHLSYVHFDNVPKMVCLPKALQHLSSLYDLSLRTLSQLNSLPDNLTFVRSLIIKHCPKLVSLPASIRGMPNLQHLIIYGCPELERRCERGTGEDWHKISHIPNLYIGRL